MNSKNLSEKKFRSFGAQENSTWTQLFQRQNEKRARQIHPIFSEGLEKLQLNSDRIPDLDMINLRLRDLTGFRGVPVEGLEAGDSFFPALARREFPIGNFIREASDLAYTPAPDVFHDLYGHIPFLANLEYANFSHDLGVRASRYLGSPEVLRQFERLYWFTVEFALIEVVEGRRIFGAGIASSIGECDFSLGEISGGGPEVLPFSVDAIRRQEYRIDQMQQRLFILKSPEQLYGCLDEFEAGIFKSFQIEAAVMAS